MTATANELLKQAVEAHAKVLDTTKPDRIEPDENTLQDTRGKKGK